MNKLGSKHKELIIFLGYCGVGIGVVGLIFVFFSLFQNIWMIFAKPEVAGGVQLVLPGLNLPGVGVLSFWHWIISIFVLAVVHEFSHGVVAAAHKMPPKFSGPALFGLVLPVIPAAYVEPDEKQLNRAEDIKQYSIYAAGPVINIVLGLLLLLLFPLVFTPIETNMSEPIGFSFVAMNESYPAGKIFTNRTIISGFNGNNVKDAKEFIESMYCVEPGEEVVLSSGAEDYVIKTVESPENPEKGFLGINEIQNERRWKNETFGKIFGWFKGLFKWMALLNIFIGIANLLPLGPVDGGLILRTFLLRTVKDSKRAVWWWGFIGWLTLALLLGGLVLPYLLR